jgi:hypothetical protein
MGSPTKLADPIGSCSPFRMKSSNNSSILGNVNNWNPYEVLVSECILMCKGRLCRFVRRLVDENNIVLDYWIILSRRYRTDSHCANRLGRQQFSFISCTTRK